LRNGKTTSCGCYQLERVKKFDFIPATRRIGARRMSEYYIWHAMLCRCYDPKNTGFHLYGGRGISVCDRWRSDFSSFLADMGPRPSPQHSIDRVDNDGNYSPENCRWADRRTQANNRRDTIIVTLGGETHCLQEWLAIVGINEKTYGNRRRSGLTPEQALSLPPRPGMPLRLRV
jgi:hypothetical protein